MKRTVLALAIIFLLIGVSVVSSNSLYTVKSQMSTFENNKSPSISLISKNLIVTVVTDKERYDIGEPIEVKIYVTNTGEEDVTLIFPTTQKADFWVNWGEIYQWSADKLFLQIFTPVTFPNGETVELFSKNWEKIDWLGNQVPVGKYQIEGWMVESIDTSPIFGNTVTITIGNNPPNPPEIDGPTSPKVGEEYTWTFYSEDPEVDNISYYVEWGDGNSSGWSYYVESGQQMCFSHKWEEKIPKYLRVKAKDIYEAESDWSYAWFRDKSGNIEYNNENDILDDYKEIITFIDGICDTVTCKGIYIKRDVTFQAGENTGVEISGFYRPWIYFKEINVVYIHAPIFIGVIFSYPPDGMPSRIWGIAIGDIEWS